MTKFTHMQSSSNVKWSKGKGKNPPHKCNTSYMQHSYESSKTTSETSAEKGCRVTRLKKCVTTLHPYCAASTKPTHHQFAAFSHALIKCNWKKKKKSGSPPLFPVNSLANGAVLKMFLPSHYLHLSLNGRFVLAPKVAIFCVMSVAAGRTTYREGSMPFLTSKISSPEVAAS